MTDERRSDIVDEAFAAMRSPAEAVSNEALERALQAAQEAQRKPVRLSLVERMRHVNKLVKFAIPAAAVLLAAAGIYWLFGHGTSITFADVQRQIEQARTMTVMVTTEFRQPTPFTTKAKVYFKPPGLMRQEVTADLNAMQRPATQPAAAPAAPNEQQKVISIFDMSKLRAVSLVPEQKKAMVIEYKNVPPEMLARIKQQDLLGELKQAVAGEHEELGPRTIDGRKTQGYRVTRQMAQAKMTTELWADAATGSPVLVEVMLPDGLAKVTMRDFVVNPDLPDSLFDTKPPEGYAIETQTMDFNVQESDFTKVLGLLAKGCGGVFPKTLMPTPDLIRQLEKNLSDVPLAQRQEIGTLLAKVISFQIATMQSGGEFVYAGEGVKLGDKAVAILWYKAKGEKAYHVIYGDLHVEQSETAPKPPPTQPAGAAPAPPAT